jgi:hypothetical protein
MVVFKFKLGKWRIAIGILPTVRTVGVYSSLPDGNHILMWDFDDKPLDLVEAELVWTQLNYALPRIYILNTGKKNHFIAYCFKRVSFELAREIIASCHDIDPEFYRLGVYRGRWTLRIGPKCGRVPKLVKVLESKIPEDVDIKELRDFVKYETVVDGYKNKVYEFGK